MEYALKKSPRQDHRHRIEHCSVCPPSLAKKLASKRILVVTQTSFLYYNGERYLKTVPIEQLQYLYPIRILIKSGVKVAGGSDCPIVPANPFIGIYSAISRRAETGDPVMEREKIDPIDALRIYTHYAAEASFEETIKGTITPGKLADLVVLEGDPTQLPPDEIRDLNVEMTILGGELVWERNN
jgi:predicted amidohydrolase YtcJ